MQTYLSDLKMYDTTSVSEFEENTTIFPVSIHVCQDINYNAIWLWTVTKYTKGSRQQKKHIRRSENMEHGNSEAWLGDECTCVLMLAYVHARCVYVEDYIMHVQKTTCMCVCVCDRCQ